MKCVECDGVAATELDPRDPPVELGACLCADCCLSVYEDMIAELSEAKEELLERVKRGGLRR
jgi:hypothetical protein